MKNRESNVKFNWPFIGNNHIVEFLSKSILNNNLAQAYVFLGPDNLGKTTIANYFAKSLLCQKMDNKAKELKIVLPCNNCSSCGQFRDSTSFFNNTDNNASDDAINITHGDFHLIKKEDGHHPGGVNKKDISIKQVREFINILSMSSFLGKYKVGVIKNAESLNDKAANALLKTLEEPKDNVVIILTTNSAESLPDTIMSRSQVLNFYPVNTDVIYDYLIKNYNAPRSAARNLSRLCLGRPALAVKFFENKEFYNNYIEKVNVFLSFINQDINKRFNSIKGLLNQNSNQELAKTAFKTIEIWKGLIRDLLLMDLGHVDLIQHQVVSSELDGLKGRFKTDSKLRIFKVLQTGEKYLQANVNPELVLENIAANI